MSFIPKQKKERNDYVVAVRNALKALKADESLIFYVLTNEDFCRTSGDYVAANAAKGVEARLAALKLDNIVAVGDDSDSGSTVVAILASGKSLDDIDVEDVEDES